MNGNSPLLRRDSYLGIAAAAVLFATIARGVAALQYQVVGLESPGAADFLRSSIARDVTDLGWVAGYGRSRLDSPWNGDELPFQYSLQSGFSIVQNLSGRNTQATAINDGGQLAGIAWGGGFGDFALRYTPGAGWQNLGSLGGLDSSSHAINAWGQVAGSSDRGDGTTGAFRVSDGVGMVDLGTLGGRNSYGHDVNDAGWVTGRAQAANGVFHAFTYRDDLGMVDLGLGAGYAINNQGVVAGFAAGWLLPVLFVEGTVQHLPLGPSFGPYAIWDLNEANVMVGEVGGRAFAGTLEEGVIDLNTLIDPESGWILSSAYGINNLGQIVGVGGYEGRAQAFLLNPIPEPSTWALLLLGVGVLAVTRRLKKE